MSTVLIVDDDANFRRLLRRIIETESINVLEAADGKQAVVIFQTESPDMAIIDVIMPGMDGIAAIEQIRRFNDRAKLIAVSGGMVFTPGTYLEQARQSGADVCMAKPFCRRHLVCTVNHMLGGTAGQDGLAPAVRMPSLRACPLDRL